MLTYQKPVSTQEFLREACSAAAFRTMPPCEFRDFFAHSLSEENPHLEQMKQLFGLPMMANLSDALFKDLVPSDRYPEVLNMLSPMFLYLTFEVISDNLMIHLGRPCKGDTTREIRRELLTIFFQAMLDRLNGQPYDVALRPLLEARELAAQLPIPALDPERLKELGHMGVSEAMLEDGVWACLIANIETAIEALDNPALFHARPILQRMFVQRYECSIQQLEDPELPLGFQIEMGQDLILVGPTLLYAAVAVSHVIPNYSRFLSILPTVEESLRQAARLVRLSNDLGNAVLKPAEALAHLAHLTQTATLDSFEHLLWLICNEKNHLFNRLRKDWLHGEYNIALNGWSWEDLDAHEAVNIFIYRLNYAGTVYRQTSILLEQTLSWVDDHLHDRHISDLVRRFVFFHEQMYTNHYDSLDGEYAI
ncbi:MAG: hypothetical protein QNJ45_08010 [Ardenticatenaceae bacterium]|nr:hypothetical protein [Ardenticatenaceae bacterium]